VKVSHQIWIRFEPLLWPVMVHDAPYVTEGKDRMRSAVDDLL